MKNKAYLVTATFITRVVVDSDCSDEELRLRILEAAAPRIEDKVFHEFNECVEVIEEDLEVPYDEEHDTVL